MRLNKRLRKSEVMDFSCCKEHFRTHIFHFVSSKTSDFKKIES